MALKDERGPKYAFSGAGTSLLKSSRKNLLLKLNVCYCYCYYITISQCLLAIKKFAIAIATILLFLNACYLLYI